ncbi:MAG: preprotein translocase subunit SecF [Thermotogaceae bacterium]|jgi:preprotein translocase subunit SecF|nr:preprotein translocase subunit SecF [Thermotogaceae bacterium]
MKREIDFVGKRRIFIAISLILIAVSVVSILVKGFNLGVDFVKGTEIVLKFNDESISIAELRNKLSEINPEYTSSRITRITSAAEATKGAKFQVILKQFFDKPELKDEFINKAQEVFGADNVEVLSFRAVSGQAAEELKTASWNAALLVIILILVYITVRFQFVYAIGAIAALIHDALITLGFYSMFSIEVNSAVIAAILTLLGYSLNDTIVVYDRIRENNKRLRGNSLDSIVNRSINEVISRTINTSLTTFFVVFILLLFAGVVLKPFAFGLTVGVIVGTYSSLYIASPIIIGWLGKFRRS